MTGAQLPLPARLLRDAATFELHHSLTVPCTGIDHLDFAADGSYLLASCEFSGRLLKIDVRRERLLGALAEEEAELLVLSPEKFKQTIYQKPDMAFEIFRELSARLRRREEQAVGAQPQQGG